jgi:hypothetical protein
MKQHQELKRLYWKTDKEQILRILQHVNPKYLSSLFRKARNQQLYDCNSTTYNCEDNIRKETYTKSMVVCKYDGCIFHVSLKTLKDEINRRSLAGGDVMLDYVYSNNLKKFYLTPIIIQK